MRAGQHHCPEALLAGMDAALAEFVILASAAFAREERPFRTPFPAPDHKPPSSGGFFCGVGLSGLSVPLTPALRLPTVPGWKAFSPARPCTSRSGPSPVPPCVAGFPVPRGRTRSAAQAGEQLRPLELLGIHSDHARGGDAKLSGPGPTTRKAPATIS